MITVYLLQEVVNFESSLSEFSTLLCKRHTAIIHLWNKFSNYPTLALYQLTRKQQNCYRIKCLKYIVIFFLNSFLLRWLKADMKNDAIYVFGYSKFKSFQFNNIFFRSKIHNLVHCGNLNSSILIRGELHETTKKYSQTVRNFWSWIFLKHNYVSKVDARIIHC
jgi:hypothetical protein